MSVNRLDFKTLKRARHLIKQSGALKGIYSKYQIPIGDNDRVSFVNESKNRLFRCEVTLYGTYINESDVPNVNKFPSVDSTLAADALSYALDKNMDAVLADMARFIKRDARKITSKAREELTAGLIDLDELDGQ